MSVERVLTVARADHFGGDWPQGFIPLDQPAARARVARFEATATYTPRPAAEADPSRKQLIPYCAVTCEGSILIVERLAAQGEARLHGRMSVGIGGHVNPTDGNGIGSVHSALRRELSEELRIAESALERAEPLGLINDDSDDVGAVHVGLAFRIELHPAERDSLQIREISKMRGHFGSLAGSTGLWQYRDYLESWSRLLVGGFSEVIGVSGSQTTKEGKDGS